jgi:Kef-type K+ transport system membrane component KefB
VVSTETAGVWSPHQERDPLRGATTSLGTLALIGVCGLAGPLLAMAGGGAVPAVVGELLAGIVIGRTGFGALDTANSTLSFLTDVGFAMLMFSVGMNVPLRDPSVRAAARSGTARAVAVGALAVAAGLLVSRIGAAGHPAVYAVLIASGSAAVVLPIVQERALTGDSVLTLIAQVTVADVAATVAIPFVLRPAKAIEAIVGTAIVAGSLILIFAVTQQLRSVPAVHKFRRESKRRRWAVDLRVALIVLFGLAWIAHMTGASVLIAGFGAGLMVAAIGGPTRLSTEVLGIAGGLFMPLFFVVLGARIDLRGVVQHPSMLGLSAALVAATVAVHVIVAAVTRQRVATGLLASAQLGVPAAIVALALPEHVITATQAAAIVLAAMISIAVCVVGAALMSHQQHAGRLGASRRQEG